MDPFLGEIRMFGGNFAPRGWALCNGAIMSIAQNSALFAILGTTFGGNGTTTFNLPDLQGRVPINQGQGPGLTPYVLGEVGGTENVTLLAAQMPAHNHSLMASSQPAGQPTPIGNVSAVIGDGQGGTTNGFNQTPDGAMAASAISISGGSQPHPNIQPFLCVNFIIALEGIFPSRD